MNAFGLFYARHNTHDARLNKKLQDLAPTSLKKNQRNQKQPFSANSY